MTTPFVGLPNTTIVWQNVLRMYSRMLPTSMVHVAVDSAGWGIVSLATCEPHVAIARACGNVLAEHAWSARCEFGDCWTVRVIE